MHKHLDWFNVALYLLIIIGCIIISVLCYRFVTVPWIKVLTIIFLGLSALAALEEILWEIDLAKSLETKDEAKQAVLFDEHIFKE